MVCRSRPDTLELHHAPRCAQSPELPRAFRFPHPDKGHLIAPEVGMQTQVSILHHDYPAHVREQVEARLQHLVKFYERMVSVRALLERQNESHRVEIVASVGHGAVLVFDARNANFGTALEEAMSGMEGQLKRHNQKQTQERRRSSRHA